MMSMKCTSAIAVLLLAALAASAPIFFDALDIQEDAISATYDVVASSEESLSSGYQLFSSPDLEIGSDGSRHQEVGFQFKPTIPVDATIESAYIQFEVDEVTTGAATFSIVAAKQANAPDLANVRYSVTSTDNTDTSVSWAPADWNTVHEIGVDQRTSDIASVVQEVVCLNGWSAGNNMIFKIKRTAGSATRTAEKTPVTLHVTYSNNGGGCGGQPVQTASPTAAPTLAPTPAPTHAPVVASSVVHQGTNNYVYYQTGTLPLIITAPHGGGEKPASVPDRTAACYDSENDVCYARYGQNCVSDESHCSFKSAKDSYTLEIATQLADKIEALCGHRPHVVVNNLHRSKLDPNREPVEACNGDPTCLVSYNEFHSFIDQASTAVTNQYSKGLMVEIHGHVHPEGLLEFGYNLGPTSLGKTDEWLNDVPNWVLNNFSLKNLVGAKEGNTWKFAEIVRGTTSFGGLMSTSTFGSYPSIPAPDRADPQGEPYFSGGYDIEVHGSKDEGTIDALQIELPGHIRKATSETRASVHNTFTNHFSAAIVHFFNTHYWTLPQVSSAATQEYEMEDVVLS